MTTLKVTLTKGKPRWYEAEGGDGYLCPDCGGPSLRMWNWDFILLDSDSVVPYIEALIGDSYMPARNLWFGVWEGDCDRNVEVGKKLLADWMDAAAALEAAVPGIIPGHVSGSAQRLKDKLDRYPDESDPLWRENNEYDSRKVADDGVEWVAAVHRWAETGSLPPPGVAGVCALHSTLVRRPAPKTPSADVTADGALIVRRGGELLAHFPPGAWKGFELED